MNLHPGHIALTTPDKPAVIIGTQQMSYAEFDRFSLSFAAQLAAYGLQQGDVLALLVDNRPEFLAAAWAAQRSGLYYLPIPTRLTADEIGYMLHDSGTKALVVAAKFEKVVQEIAVDPAIAIYGLDDNSAFEPVSNEAANTPLPPAIEGGDMLYTSGTTGRPKAVCKPLSGEILGTDTSRVKRAAELFGLNGDSVFLTSAPLYHAAPLRFAMNLLRTGGTVVGMRRFDAAEALATIAREKVTHSQWVPTMFSRMLRLGERERSRHDLSSHICAIHAGAPCPPDIKRQMIGWWGPILHEYYSGTESIGFTHIDSHEWHERPGSVGQPHGCKIHIVDQSGSECPPGLTGDVYFESNATLSYHNDDEKTAAAHNEHGWATMGDVGYVDQEGYLYLTDRRHFTIISGGVNIYPTEIENAISSDPAVSDCAVFGVPEPDLGEAVMAVIELQYQNHNSEDTALGLIEKLKRQIAPHKLPRYLMFASVGRTETGKLQKAALQSRYGNHARRIDVRALAVKRQGDRAA